jgi:hypothetical protein
MVGNVDNTVLWKGQPICDQLSVLFNLGWLARLSGCSTSAKALKVQRFFFFLRKVNGCYDLLFSLHFSTLANADFLSTVRWIRDTFVPLKIVLFRWKLLQDINPIQPRLNYGGEESLGMSHLQCFVLCFDEIELTGHLFVNCRKTQQIWELIFKHLYWRVDSWSKGNA